MKSNQITALYITIQAPENYRVFVYSYFYVTIDTDHCVEASSVAASLTAIYDEKIAESSLLYRLSWIIIL